MAIVEYDIAVLLVNAIDLFLQGIVNTIRTLRLLLKGENHD